MATTTRSSSAKRRVAKSSEAASAPKKDAAAKPAKTAAARGFKRANVSDPLPAGKPKRVVRGGAPRRRQGQEIKKKALLSALAEGSGDGVAVAKVAKILKRDAGDAAVAGLRDALNLLLAPSDPKSKPDPELWGPEPGATVANADEQAVRAAVETSLQAFRDRSWTRREAAQHLALTEQAVSERVRKGQLAGLRIAGRLYLPAWQFTDDGVCEGLDVLLARWPSTVVSLDRWVQTRHPDLDAKPAGVLRRRQGLAAVLEVMEADAVSRW